MAGPTMIAGFAVAAGSVRYAAVASSRGGADVCTAVRVVVCAPAHRRRLALRRAASGLEWQIVAAVAELDDALGQMRALRGRVLVVDADARPPGDLPDRLAAACPGASLVGIGDVPGAAAAVPADDLSGLRATLAAVVHAEGGHVH